jgi:electron-transferring-flavoprotein dehydrogenase
VRGPVSISLALIMAPGSECKPIEYPAPQPPLSTDLLTAVALTATNHGENQPVHLQLPHMGVENFDSSAVSLFDTSEDGLVDASCRLLKRDTSMSGSTSPNMLVFLAVPVQRPCMSMLMEASSQASRLLFHIGCMLTTFSTTGTLLPEGKEEDAGYGGKKLVINSQNCIHCKLCDIKVPTQDINWTVPEGGGGPKYSG